MKRRRKFNKWSWHHRVLLSLRDQLLQQRAQRLHDASETLEPHSLDIADSATDELDHSLTLSRLSVEQENLYEIEEAIKRIDDGTYGFCAETGKPISALRLRAIPWTRFSMEAELRLERSRDIKPQHLGELKSVNA
jgi:RNA polymerase-binding protein DksA